MSNLPEYAESLLKRFGLECQPDTTEEVEGSAVLERDIFIVTGNIEELTPAILAESINGPGMKSESKGKFGKAKNGDVQVTFNARSFDRLIRVLEYHELQGMAAEASEEEAYYYAQENPGSLDYSHWSD